MHDDVRREAVGQFALVVDGGHEFLKLRLSGQVAAHQQVRDLFISEPTVVAGAAHQVVDIVTAQRQLTGNGHLLTVGKHVAVNIRDVRYARDDAGAVGVAQAALHIESLVVVGIDAIDLYDVVVELKVLLRHKTAPLVI